MAGWGIMGGSAVDTYAKHKKDARDAAWEDQQRAEWARIRDEQLKLDAAVNGGAAAAPPAAMPPGGLQVDKMGQGLPAPAVTGAEPVAQAPAPKKRRSEQMIEAAERVRASGTGVKGLELAMKLEQNASEIMTKERDEELTNILRSQEPPEQKIEKMLAMAGDSKFVPGTVGIVQGKDGLYLQHMVPGRDKPFQQKIEGNPLQFVAMRVRALLDPNIYFKQLEAQRQQGQLDNDTTRTQNTHEYQMGMLGVARDNSENRIKIAQMSKEQSEERMRLTRGNYTPAGLDKDGAMVSFDKNTGEMRRADGKPVQDPELFRKFVGGGPAAPAMTPVQENAAKKLQQWIVDNPDAPPAQIISMGKRLGVPAQAMPADPIAAALPKPGGNLMGGPGKGVPTKAAAPVARGLPAAPKPEDPAIAGLQARLNQLDKNNPQHVAEIMRLGTMINQRRQQLGQFN